MIVEKRPASTPADGLRWRTTVPLLRLFYSLLLCLLLGTDVVSGWPLAIAQAHAAALAAPTPPTMTLQKFLAQKINDGHRRGPFQYPSTVPSIPGASHASKPQAPLPSTEPAKMQPVSLGVDNSLLSTSGLSAHGRTASSSLTANPLHVRGSDGRLEVTIAPGSLDLSHATVTGGATPVAPFTVHISQLHGHLVGSSSILGSYQIQLLDQQGRVIQGVQLLQPATIVYHYQPWEMRDLGLDPGQIRLSWPTLLQQAHQQKQATTGLVTPMTLNAQAQTLTAQTSVLASQPFDVSGNTANQTPQKPQLASMNGNSGQLSYTYPITVPAGTDGFEPHLQLSYSSSAPNQRYSNRSPAENVGDGWSLSLGSISIQSYPSTSTSGAGTWYFLNNVAGVSDRLVLNPTTGLYETEHISHLRIQFNGTFFQVWDRSGFYYEYGSTPDSAQYTTDSNGVKTTWRWDLHKILAPYESTSQVKTMFVSYLQDTTQSGSFTSVRDANIKQITYGYATSTTATSLSVTAGTVDFHYHAPTAQGTWADAYGTNYHCSTTPPQSTTLRCDDPVTVGTVAAPAIMSTLTLDSITSYVGTDGSNSNLAFRYNFSYQDIPFSTNYVDPQTNVTESAAGEHLLTSIVPTVYQNGTAHARKAMSLSYSGPATDRYYDSANLVAGQPFASQTHWQYLTRYQDLNTGVGASVTYSEGFGNTHGTPYVTDSNGNVTDDRLDPLYCPNNANNPDTSKRCTGVYTHPEEKAWSTQLVTQIQALGTDTSGTAQDPISLATTTYHYGLATTGSDPSCNPITGSEVPAQEGQCVRDTWIPGYNSNHVSQPDGDWQDYYHSEYRGFNIVYTTGPAGDVTADYYFSTEAWYTPQTDGPNYSAGALYQEDSYWGNQLTDNLIMQRIVNQYVGPQGSMINSCNTALNATYTPCEVVLTSTRTSYTEGAGTGNANTPWVEHDYTYDDINGQGLVTSTPAYHNMLQEAIISKDAPTITKKWTYQVNDQVASNVRYYHVDAVSHSEIDDESGHVWQCQDVTYDQGVATGVPAPAAGLVTTATAHSDCSHQSTTALNTYTGYDVYGNMVATVDPIGVANPSLYNGAAGQRFNQQGTSFYWGFNSGSGDTPTGEMHSQTVTLGGNGQVDFLVGGGNDINNLYVALVRASDNAILFKATGTNSESMQRVTWNASADIGTAVYLKVVDNSSGGWGHINLDDVHIAGASLPNADFEQGNLSGWIIVSGTAFQDINVVSKNTANNGCGLATAPAYISSAWSGTRWYASCTTYDSFGARPTSTTNAIAQSSSTTYDYTQGGLPISAVDLNGQTTTMSYSFDANGNRTVQAKLPLETGSFTKQSSTNSTCTSSSTLPCYEVDTVSSQYPGAITRTFYDSMGRVAETRTPLDSMHDLIVYTVHDEVERDAFQSLPFRVARGTTWLDPGTATDDIGATPGGTVTTFDPLGRIAATQDPLIGSAGEPGISCLGLQVTACYDYGFDQVAGSDTNWYHWHSVDDANSHLVVSFDDTLGRTRYEQWYSSDASPSSNVTAQKQIQYNALDKPTSVTMTDLTPQPGQTITSVTSTATYDDLGRMTSSTDPDRGNHTLTYDADGRLLTDVSGTRTLGMSYDQLGRIGCIQDAASTTNGYGGCTGSAHSLMRYAYDVTTLGTSGTSDFSLGQMTRSVATTYYPDGSAATTTQQMQHDQRGRITSAMLQLGVPSSWNVTTALPTYQENLSYNDADQLMTTQTTVGGQAGYTFSQAYDSITGLLTGLSNNTTGVANLATLGYDVTGSISDVNFQTTTGTALANDHFTYDGDLRPATTNATWQSGSGSTGTIFSQGRSYDAVGNVTSISTTLAPVPGQSGSGGSETQNFCYDEQNRLVWAGNSGTQPAPGIGTCGSGTLSSGLTGAGYNIGYAYTHLGQLWQGPLNGGGTYQYLYCNSSHPHQLTGLYPTGTTCSNLTGAVYTSSNDNWGNVTTRTYNGSTATLSYDLLDHFVQWNAGATSQEWYAYDMGGNRTLRRSTTSSGTTITVYAFGLEEHVYSSSGSPQSGTYYYSLGGRLIGELQGSTTQFFLTDALGSILTTFNAVAGSAAVQGNQLYGPYGTSRYSQGTMGTAKGFTGQYADVTGLDYYNARYYDPVIGEFLTADLKQGNASGMDPYGYVGGNPETNTDPTGEYFAQMGDSGVVQSIARFSNTVVDGQRAISVWTETLGTRKTTTSTHKIHPAAPCTLSSCSVKLGKTVYSLDKLKHGDPQTRLDFLRDFYNQFAPGWGKAEGDFVAYLVKTGRITGGDGYWDVADFDLLRDQLVAAYDMINHQAAQSTLVGNWIAFVRHPNNDGWWVAHNGSINAGDQQARASGLYSKESWLEQRFINEAVHVVNGVQWVLHGEYNPLAGLGPQSPATGIFTQMFYPSGHDDFSVATSFANQAGFAVSNGGIIGLGVFLWSLT